MSKADSVDGYESRGNHKAKPEKMEDRHEHRNPLNGRRAVRSLELGTQVLLDHSREDQEVTNPGHHAVWTEGSDDKSRLICEPMGEENGEGRANECDSPKP